MRFTSFVVCLALVAAVAVTARHVPVPFGRMREECVRNVPSGAVITVVNENKVFGYCVCCCCFCCLWLCFQPHLAGSDVSRQSSHCHRNVCSAGWLYFKASRGLRSGCWIKSRHPALSPLFLCHSWHQTPSFLGLSSRVAACAADAGEMG